MPRRRRSTQVPDPDFDDGLGESLLPIIELDKLTHEELARVLGTARITVHYSLSAQLDNFERIWKQVAERFPDPGGIKRRGISLGAYAYRQLKTLRWMRALLARPERSQADLEMLVSLAIDLGFEHADAKRRFWLGNAARAGLNQSRTNRASALIYAELRQPEVEARHTRILELAKRIRKTTRYDRSGSNTQKLAEQIAERLSMNAKSVRAVLDQNRVR